ncbi:DUF4145 domain-containing protein [Natronolimnobius sp. AArcel1]|uniref:DUF4145 domain-containing protein n=1 Tax=Natronolimnobius sp. AArcel1 TaxID=1679093 RepID=UPI0013EB7496|nr:DUF4145 domain-containing protein [Natronolimnobius sp. AArcel1]NGM69176.1 DUF4145 domain-containing protein [Natronolimnobius sp. AArcel1]
MAVSEGEVEEYISDLDNIAVEIIENTEAFFRDVEVETEFNQDVLSATHSWKTPGTSTKRVQRRILEGYQEWYAGGRVLISEYMESDLAEFDHLRDVFYEKVTLSSPPNSSESLDAYSTAHDAFVTQKGMVNAIPRKIAGERLKAKEQISKSVAKDEVQRAWQLFEEGLLRASGVTAGVALERHLLTLCQESESNLEFSHDDGIASLADVLYKADEIDKTTLNALQTLSTIRNDCAHANQSEPNEHKVRRLLNDTEDYIRGRGL